MRERRGEIRFLCEKQYPLVNFCVQLGKTPTETKNVGGIREVLDSVKIICL
jgi:hypothetical protein